jgi:hypothetical protein
MGTMSRRIGCITFLGVVDRWKHDDDSMVLLMARLRDKCDPAKEDPSRIREPFLT